MGTLKDELVNFPKIDLDSISDNDMSFSEDVREAVSLYNSAIDRIKQNNNDIAIIELKKAIGIFPEFYDAILLLGVCIFFTGDKMNAINIFNSIRDDEERRRAITYLEKLADKSFGKYLNRLDRKDTKSTNKQDIAPEARKSFSNASIKNQPKSNDSEQSSNNKINKKRKHDMVQKIEPKGIFATEKKSFLDNPLIFKSLAYIAAILVIVILFSLAFQAIKRISMTDSPEFVELENKYKDELEKSALYKDKYEQLKQKNSELYSKYILNIINDEYNKKNYDKLVDLIYMLDLDVFTNPDDKGKVETINKEALSHFTSNRKSKGDTYYYEKKYSLAISEYERIRKYNPTYEQIHWVLNNLGRSYSNIGKKNEAIQVFDQLVSEHGNTDVAKEVIPLLNQLIKDANLDRTPVPIPTPKPTNESTASATGTYSTANSATSGYITASATPKETAKPTVKPTVKPATPKPTVKPTVKPTATVKPTVTVLPTVQPTEPPASESPSAPAPTTQSPAQTTADSPSPATSGPSQTANEPSGPSTGPTGAPADE